MLFAASGCGLFIGLLIDAFYNQGERSADRRVPLATYAVGQIVPQVFGAALFCTTVDIFVPLVGFVLLSASVALCRYLFLYVRQDEWAQWVLPLSFNFLKY